MYKRLLTKADIDLVKLRTRIETLRDLVNVKTSMILLESS